jgi:SnoaL-like domain
MNEAAEVVERFATALDCDDYETGSTCMEPDAVYEESGGKRIVGREAILRSFQDASVWGHEHLDDLRFLHEIDQSTPLSIRFIDVLSYGGEECVVDHTMHLTFSDAGRIRRLRLVYPAGERERVSAFFQRHNLKR